MLWQRGNTGFKALLSAVLLAKCLRARMWENSRYVTRQLQGIGAYYHQNIQYQSDFNTDISNRVLIYFKLRHVYWSCR